MRHLLLSVFVIACLMILAGPVHAQTASVERGMKVVVDSKCSVCHSIAGKGNPKGVLDGVGAKLSADEIRQWIVSPQEMTAKTKATRKPPMKSFASMPKEDVDAVVAYLLTLKGK
jgi:mono/diheme cytochrome c family protein